MSIAITFDDVLLVPRYSTVMPQDVSLQTQGWRGMPFECPLWSAAMDTVTEAPMAIAMAQTGGLGVIHKNNTPEAQAQQVAYVKKFESGVIRDPITVSPGTTVADVRRLQAMHRFSAFPVCEGKRLVGMVTNRDLRFAKDEHAPVSKYMTRKLVTVPEGTDQAVVMEKMHAHRIEKILLVDEQAQLRGMMTVKDILQSKERPLATKDQHGRLCVGAAVGVGEQSMARVDQLVAQGVDVLVLDSAHGHSLNVITTLQRIKRAYPQQAVVVGNIVTGEAALALEAEGADAVKVGVGPGSICTTRVVAGVGVPQITAIQSVAEALQGRIPLIADGGIRYSGDVAKALAAGANSVMIGSLLAGTEESPGEVNLFQGRAYKEYRGMGSLAAMTKGSSERYFQADTDSQKLVPEGIEGRVPFKGSMESVVHQLMGGVRASMGYTGSPDLARFREASFVQVSGASLRENHPHDITITKEAPNYSKEGA